MIYLDTSAAIKALLREDETDDVRALFASDQPMIASRLLAVELSAVTDRRAVAAESVNEVVSRVALVSMGDDTLDLAIGLHSGLRTLDALHLATARYLGDLVDSVLTFDKEFISACRRFGLPLHPLCDG